MINKNLNKDFKNFVKDHFNKFDEDNLNILDYSPDCIDPYLLSPYDFINGLFLKQMNKKKILDYCCGIGINSVNFSKYGAEVTGIDISENSINKAKKKFKLLNLSNYTLKNMDAHNLQFENNSFDFIFSYKSLLYLDLEISFKELNRVLKKDGKLIILENISDNLIFKYYRFIKHKLQKKKFTKELNKIYTKDLNIFSKYFICVEKKYFDFFSVLGKIIADSIKIKFPNKFLFYLDNLFLNIFKIKFLSFTVVIVLEKK